MRLVSLAPGSTEILYALGCKPVAVTRFCDYPLHAKQRPKVGGWLDIDYRRLQELQPDLVCTSPFVQDRVVAELERRKIDVVHVDPVTLDGVFESIMVIGTAVNRQPETHELVVAMKARQSRHETSRQLALM